MKVFHPQHTRHARAGLSASFIALIVCMVALPFSIISSPIAQAATTVLRVNNSSTALFPDGSTWGRAYDTLQDALAAANPAGGDDVEIWVAEGIYYPDEGGIQTNNDPLSTFQLKSDVAIYGGFDGTENERNQRDPDANITVLSGDIDLNDITGANGVVLDTADIAGTNAYHVVKGADDATLDGVTITAGYADGSDSDIDGGGMYNENSSPILTNVTFSGNWAYSDGGGMSNENSSPTLTNVIFFKNQSSGGGGMANLSSSSPTLTNVTFSGNSAGSIGIGGGMFNYINSSPTLTNVDFFGNSAFLGGGISSLVNSNLTLTNVTISGNSASVNGGGMLNTASNLILTNVTISGNHSGSRGGGIYNESRTNLTLTNVTISGNQAGADGGGMFNEGSSPTIQNSIIWGNAATDSGPQVYNKISSNPNVPLSTPIYTNALVENSGGSGAGWDTALGTDNGNNLDVDPQFVSFWGPSNAPTTTGIYQLNAGSPAINSGDNDADLDADGGGNATISSITTDRGGNPRIQENIVDIGAYEAPGPNFTLSKTVDNDTPEPGDIIQYTITVNNNGSRDTYSADISDTLPPGLSFVANSLTIAGVEQPGVTPPVLAENRTLAPYWPIELTYQVEVSEDLLAGTVLVNNAEVSSEEVPIPIDTNESITVAAVPAIAVSVTPDVSSAEVGEEIAYSYQVVNTGNVTLSGVSATDDTFGSITLDSTTLAPGAEATGSTSYTVLEGDLPGPVANSVTAMGTPPVGDDVSATDTASVGLIQIAGDNPPSLIFTTATNVQAHDATLQASVNPNGLATTITFAWGTTPGGPYSNEQDANDVLSGTQMQTTNLSLSGLTPNTTYYYIVTVTNADGSVTSSEQRFTTTALEGTPAYRSIPEPSSTLDVGTVSVGESGTVIMELREVGSADLEVSDPSISGADAASFRIEATTSFPLTIADGADAVTLSVVCTPEHDGTYSATLTLTTNDTDLPTVSYPLACTGEASDPVDTNTTLYLPLIAR